MNEKDYTTIILEEVRSQYQAITELVQDVPQIKNDVASMKTDISAIKDDMDIIKTVVKDHETRITTLETDPQAA